LLRPNAISIFQLVIGKERETLFVLTLSGAFDFAPLLVILKDAD